MGREQLVGARLVRSYRLLAQIAIADAVAASGEPGEIRDANKALAKGDQALAKGNYQSGFDHFRHAWEEAIKFRAP